MQVLNRMVLLKRPYRKLLLALADIFLISICYLGCWMLINGRVSLSEYLPTLLTSWLVYVAVFSASYFIFGMYNSLWRYAEAYEYSQCILATLVAAVAFGGITLILMRPPWFAYRVPISIYFISAMMSGMSALILRLLYRAVRTSRLGIKSSHEMKKVLLVGAGETGNTILQDIARETNRRYDVVSIVDDDPDKIGRRMQRIMVEGSTDAIPRLVEQYGIDVIILAMPKLSGESRHRITSICAKTKCQLKKVPDLYSLVTGAPSILRQIQDVSVEDLLGREAVDLGDQQPAYLKDKCVMVTGAGGSIGSELCRQILAYKPTRLVMIDIYENGVYEIQQEMLRKYGSGCPIAVEIASVRDRDKIDCLFARYKPQVIYHAAAHKHVPLMESVPEEAVKNNVFGTLNVAECADTHGAEKFVLISSDKAVNPTNVMGATKRVCEKIILEMNERSDTDYVAVRFGNVLGSNGSVIPLFKQQVAEGGPVTVTDPNVIRYFMTITEAVSLVLIAGAMATGGEIFVLDMGSPVKILDLAESIIRLSGYEPYQEIDIQITGMRPGEKLYEELLISDNDLSKTQNEKIYIEKSSPDDMTQVLSTLHALKNAAAANKADQVSDLLQDIVPEYTAAKSITAPEESTQTQTA